MILLYALGIVTAVFMAMVMKLSIFKGEPVPFVMELPNYRMPSSKVYANFFGIKQKTSCKEPLR